MTIRVPWLNRTFDFGFPVSDYSKLLVRLESTPERLAEAAAGVPKDVLSARRGDAWSIQEHAGHLLDLEELHLGRLDDYDAGRDFLRIADLLNRKTLDAHHNDHTMEEILRGFRRERGEFLRRLNGMVPDRYEQTAIHPRLHIAIRIVDMMYFAAEHDDHHLASIAELMAGASARQA